MGKITSWRLRVLGLAAVLSALPGYALGQYQMVTAGRLRTPPLTSVLGEARDYGCLNSADNGTVCRFHQGVDAAGAGFTAGTEVEAIESGTVTTLSAHTVVVTNSSGHIFRYIHVLQPTPPLVTQGQQVNAGDPLAQIQCLGTGCSQTHLHLDEADSIDGEIFDLNPQRSGALIFSDVNDTPGFETLPTSGVTGGVAPVTQATNGLEEGDVNANVNLFPVLADGSYLLNGMAAVLVEARGGPTRKGVYNVGLTVAPVSDPFNFVYTGNNNIDFDSIISGATLAAQAAGVAQGVKSIYYRTRDTNSDTYIATNVKENFSPFQVSNNPAVNDLNPANFPPGQYEICANLESIPAAPFIDTGEQCVSFPTMPLPFLVGRRDNAVIRGEVLSGLKFRMERRAYRQAGRNLGPFSFERSGASACMA